MEHHQVNGVITPLIEFDTDTERAQQMTTIHSVDEIIKQKLVKKKNGLLCTLF